MGSERGKIFLNHNVTRSQAPTHHPMWVLRSKPQKQNWSGPSVLMVHGNKELPTRYNSSPPIKPILKSRQKHYVLPSTNGVPTCHPILESQVPEVPPSSEVAETTRAKKTSPLGPMAGLHRIQSKSQEGSFKIYPTWGFKLIFYLISK